MKEETTKRRPYRHVEIEDELFAVLKKRKFESGRAINLIASDIMRCGMRVMKLIPPAINTEPSDLQEVS